MTATAAFDIISKIPAKGFDWTGFQAALRADYVAKCSENKRSPLALRGLDAANGLREIRFELGCMANAIVDLQAIRSKFIAPSPETLAWGGFLGGETVVWRDDEAGNEGVAHIAAIVAQFRKGK